MNKYIGAIRDFFFPMMDRLSREEIEKEKQKRNKCIREIEETKFRPDEADIMLQFAGEYEKREDSRLHEVESKATVFIGTFAVAVTILMGLLKDFLSGSGPGLFSNIPSWLGTFICLLLLLAIFYLCFAIINSIKALQRNTFNVLGAKETMHVGSYPSIILDSHNNSDKKDCQNYVANKKIEIARKKLLYTYKNETVINRKVDYMTLAQKFFMHAVVVLLIMILMLVAYLILNKTGVQIINWWNSLSSIFKSRGTATPSNTP